MFHFYSACYIATDVSNSKSEPNVGADDHVPPVGKQKRLTEPAPILPDVVKRYPKGPRVEDDAKIDYNDWLRRHDKELHAAFLRSQQKQLVDDGAATDKGKGKQRASAAATLPKASSSKTTLAEALTSKAKAPAVVKVKHSDASNPQ